MSFFSSTVDDVFYKSSLRLNGAKLLKKSKAVSQCVMLITNLLRYVYLCVYVSLYVCVCVCVCL